MILPTFENPEQPSKRIDFRRLLLNKCQVEFEKGIEADSKVKAREEQEHKGGTTAPSDAAAADAPPPPPSSEDVAAAKPAEPAAPLTPEPSEAMPAASAAAPAAAPAGGEELEEGEIPPLPAPPAAPVDPRVAAEQERQARRRMLGNMQFIGQLYKYGLLTERIMHNCVQQLLQVRGGRYWSISIDPHLQSIFPKWNGQHHALSLTLPAPHSSISRAPPHCRNRTTRCLGQKMWSACASC